MRNKSLIVLMCVAVAGCTRLGIGSSESQTWDVGVDNTPEGCRVEIKVNKQGEQTDETTTINHPKIGGK
jgi:hypothetical protein